MEPWSHGKYPSKVIRNRIYVDAVKLWDLLEDRTLFNAFDSINNAYSPEFHLFEMASLLGPPPPELLKRGKKTSEYFTAEGTKSFFICQIITLRSSLTLNPRNVITQAQHGFKRSYLRELRGILDWGRQETLSRIREENAKVEARRPSYCWRTSSRSLVEHLGKEAATTYEYPDFETVAIFGLTNIAFVIGSHKYTT